MLILPAFDGLTINYLKNVEKGVDKIEKQCIINNCHCRLKALR
jgi:hypothetical protein